MKILILAAMDKEVALLIDLPEEIQLLENGDIKYYKGIIGNHEIYVAKCGIGKVNSAINSFRLITIIKPDIVLNSGVAGGAGIPIGSVLVPDRICYWDVWCGPGTRYGQADGFPLFMKPDPKILELAETSMKPNLRGLICSGDKFISTAEELNFIRDKFPDVMAVDMESASISQVCCRLEIPFAIIRVVSDTPGEGENIEQYKNFWTEAPKKTFEILSDIIERL